MPLQLLRPEDLEAYRSVQYSEEATRPDVEAEASAEHVSRPELSPATETKSTNGGDS